MFSGPNDIMFCTVKRLIKTRFSTNIKIQSEDTALVNPEITLFGLI